MTSAEPVATRRPGGPIYRLGRTGSVWSWPDWAYAGEDGTFGNRFDDPDATFRVLYASSQRLGTFLETLARFRPDPHVMAAEIAKDDQDAAYPTSAAGRLPRSWLSGRSVGRATIDANFVDLGQSATLAHLRAALAGTILRHGLDDLDAAAIRLSIPRRLTQEIAAYLYGLAAPDGERYQGIEYLSRLGDDVENWAIWEPAVLLMPQGDEPIVSDDPDMIEALGRFGLTLDD